MYKLGVDKTDLNLLLEKLNNTDKSFEDLSYMLFTYFEPFTYGPTYDERENEKYHQAKKYMVILEEI